jgi:hypothetical protein
VEAALAKRYTHIFGVKGVVRNTQDSMILSMRGELYYFLLPYTPTSTMSRWRNRGKQHTGFSILWKLCLLVRDDMDKWSSEDS